MFVHVLDDTQEVNPFSYSNRLLVQARVKTRVTLASGADDGTHPTPISETDEHKLYKIVPKGPPSFGSWTYRFYYEEALGITRKEEEFPGIFVVTLMYDDITKGHWGLIMGELNFEMEFIVHPKLARAWSLALEH
jgi:hypothetical protein